MPDNLPAFIAALTKLIELATAALEEVLENEKKNKH